MYLKYTIYICTVILKQEINGTNEVVSILKKGLVHIRDKRPDLAELQRICVLYLRQKTKQHPS